MHMMICTFGYYLGRVIQLLRAERANTLHVHTTHSAHKYEYICYRESYFQESHSQTVESGKHTHIHTERIRILITCTHLNATTRTLGLFGVIKLLVLFQTFLQT